MTHAARTIARIRPLVLVVLVAIAAATVAFAAPAAAAGPPPIVDETPETPTPVADGFEGTMPSTGSRAANGTMTASGDRKGLGFPSYKQLLGKGWKATAAKADRRFAEKLDASESVPGPGDGGRAAVDPVAEFDRMFKVKDVVKGRGGKQQRDLRVAATLDGGCPTLNELGTGFNWKGTGRAVYEVRTTERAGRYDLVTAVVLDGHFRNRPWMMPTAVADDFHTNDFGEISITRNQIAVDRKTGKRHSVGETERFTSTLDPFYKPEGGFEAFIASQDDGAPAPSRPLRSDVWEEMAMNFMVIPYLALQSRVLEAEKYAQTPNRCVRLEVEAPATLAPGAKVELTGVPKLVNDPGLGPFPILEHSDRVRAYYINEQHGQSARQLHTKMHQLWNGAPWYEFTAPPKAWPDATPAGIELELLSGAGVASTDVTFKAEQPTLHFEVLDASFDTHAQGSTGSPLCGEVGGTRSFGGGHHPTGFDPTNRLEYGPGGHVRGKISGLANALWYDQTVFGCKDDGEDLVPCEESLPDRAPTSGTTDVWVAFNAANNPHEVVLDWAVHDPDIGYFDAGNEQCYSYVVGDVDNDDTRQTIPRSQLQSGEPIDLSLTGSVHLDTHGGFQPASIDYDFEYSLTVQRVNADGSPLP